jgi:transposase InsO family protein
VGAECREDSIAEAKVVIEEWKNTYNKLRPHSSLAWKFPAACAAGLSEK